MNQGKSRTPKTQQFKKALKGLRGQFAALAKESRTMVSGERTLRSETSKVFLVILVLLVALGSFMSISAVRGARAFDEIQNVYLEQFHATEEVRGRALDIVAIYFLMGTDHDLDLLMTHMEKFDSLVAIFDKSLSKVEGTIGVIDSEQDRAKMRATTKEIKTVFEQLNMNARSMTFALMEGRKADGTQLFKSVEKDVTVFKGHIDTMYGIVNKQLRHETASARTLLSRSTWLGIVGTLLAVLATMGLVYNLNRFISQSGLSELFQDNKALSFLGAYRNLTSQERLMLEQQVARFTRSGLAPGGSG